ncbi:MAG: hypothetical protein HRU14_16370, partial [Planctomycetes bacterium]|nr:hypothetical protein [Planctomycetota bacterium]
MPFPARFLSLALCILVVPLHAQSVPAATSVLQALDISVGTVQSLVPSGPAGPFTFPIWIGDVQYEVRCQPHSLRAPDFQVLADGPGGRVPVPAPAPTTYRGAVSGLYGSVVAISRSGPSISGVIRLPGTTIGIQPVRDVDPSAAPDAHVVYDAHDNVAMPGTCVVVPVPALGGVGTGGVRGGLGNLKFCEIGIDCDVQFYNANGNNLNNTVLDAENVMNGTDAIYQSDVSIGYIITTVIVRTSSGSNPYTTNNASNLLSEFRNYWNANHTGVQRDVAHLMTGRNLSG